MLCNQGELLHLVYNIDTKVEPTLNVLRVQCRYLVLGSGIRTVSGKVSNQITLIKQRQMIAPQ